MIGVYDADARVLPRPTSERAGVNAWQAWSACSADLRAKSAPHREIAVRLWVRDGQAVEAGRSKA